MRPGSKYPSDDVSIDTGLEISGSVFKARITCASRIEARRRFVFGLLGAVMSVADYLEIGHREVIDFVESLQKYKAEDPQGRADVARLDASRRRDRERS